MPDQHRYADRWLCADALRVRRERWEYPLHTVADVKVSDLHIEKVYKFIILWAIEQDEKRHEWLSI